MSEVFLRPAARLQPTYEDLKRVHGIAVYAALCKRLQPTYEDLKHSFGLAGGLAHVRLQPTYEDLKPHRCTRLQVPYSPVCSLPNLSCPLFR